MLVVMSLCVLYWYISEDSDNKAQREMEDQAAPVRLFKYHFGFSLLSFLFLSETKRGKMA